MNRVLVLLVASLLGTACVSGDTCDARTVSIAWPSFLLANGTVTNSCAVAQINTVDVFMDNNLVGSFNCTDGGVNVTGVLNDGDHLFDVEGIDSVSGAIALRDSFTVSNSNCHSPLVNAQPSEGTVQLTFSFSPNTCSSDVNSFMWFTIHDDIANQDITVDSAHTPQAYSCSTGHAGDFTPLPIQFALASGNYTFQRMEEVVYPAPPVQAAGNCTATAFDITGGTAQPISVGLTDGVTCF